MRICGSWKTHSTSSRRTSSRWAPSRRRSGSPPSGAVPAPLPCGCGPFRPLFPAFSVLRKNLKKAVDNPGKSWYNNSRRRERHTSMWGISSAGRALAWHARGQRFDPAILHQKSTVLRWKYGAFPFLYTKIAGNRFVAARMECNVLLFSESERFAQFNNSFQIGSRCHAALARAAVQNHDFHFQYSLFRLCYDARQIAICCAIIPHRKS